MRPCCAELKGRKGVGGAETTEGERERKRGRGVLGEGIRDGRVTDAARRGRKEMKDKGGNEVG